MYDFLDYEQHLSDALKNLYFDDARYKRLRETINDQCKDNDDDLIFAVRKNEIHIYYRGGRLLKIADTAKGTSLKIYTDPKYAGDEHDPNNEIVKLNALDTSEKENVTIWCEKLDKLKDYVARYYTEHGNKERLLQHKLELNNRDFKGEVVIIDNEYGVRKLAAKLTHLDKSKDNFGEFTETELQILSKHEPKLTAESVRAMSDDELKRLKLEYKLCKVDLVALFKGDDGKYKICLIELKKGYDAIGGKAGIKDHIQDFKIFIQYRKDDIIKSVENLIEYKKSKAVNTITNYPADGIELDTENIYVSILCYDLSTLGQIKSAENNIKQVYDDEAKKILPHLHYNLRLKETDGYTLIKASLLAN